MSAIGDYVHFYQSNYDAYGIRRVPRKDGSKDSNKPNISWSDASSAIMAKTRISDMKALSAEMQKANNLQDEMNSIFYPKENDELATKYRDQMIDIVSEVLNEEYGIAAGQVNYADWSVEETALSQEVLQKVEETRGKHQVAMSSATSTAQALQRRINQMLYRLGRMGAQESSDLFKEIEDAKNELKAIKSRLVLDKAKNQPALAQADINSLNNIIKIWNRMAPLANQKGDLFEWLIPFIALKGKNLTREEIKEAIKKANLGASSTKLEYQDLLGQANLDVAFQTGNIKTKTATVRNKTDVILQYQIPGVENQKISYNISAKNVKNLEIKLVDSTSLYRILAFSQGLNFGNSVVYFATHYLNIITISRIGGQANPGDIKNANEITRGLILKIAAEGYDPKMAADFLVVNSQSEQRIRVYSIKALVHFLSEASQDQRNLSKGFIKGFDEGYHINQDFKKNKDTQAGVKDRLASVIDSLNKTKITVILSQRDLEKYAPILTV